MEPIETDEQHAAALAEVERLMDADVTGADAERLAALAAQVVAYEKKRWPMTPRDGRDLQAIVDLCAEFGAFDQGQELLLVDWLRAALLRLQHLEGENRRLCEVLSQVREGYRR